MFSAVVHATIVTPAGKDVEIAPGVRMPFVSDGIILDARANHTGEVKGLDLFFKLGGRGVDTAWSCQSHLLSAASEMLCPIGDSVCIPVVLSDHNQPEVGLAIREASIHRNEIFLTTKIECMGTADAAYAAIQRDLR